MVKKENLKKETETLQITAPNNALRINCIKARIDKMQQNSQCRLCGDRDETINHIVSECSNFAEREDKSKEDFLGKVDSLGILQEIEI